ncbi:Fc receptor-like protein 4 [Vicugna pacos]|uniref:Fc receptor-like protein 4 n=1 Tax=Vicugna pacos TaxID=30538 RepID=A0ABM5C2Y1_VICPA
MGSQAPNTTYLQSYEQGPVVAVGAIFPVLCIVSPWTIPVTLRGEVRTAQGPSARRSRPQKGHNGKGTLVSRSRPQSPEDRLCRQHLHMIFLHFPLSLHYRSQLYSEKHLVELTPQLRELTHLLRAAPLQDPRAGFHATVGILAGPRSSSERTTCSDDDDDFEPLSYWSAESSPFYWELSPVPISKSVISLQPPWTPVFRGERVNLTCDGFRLYAPERVEWYHVFSRRRNSSETMGNILEVRDSGEYRCRAPGSLLSNPVQLIFHPGYFILQAPYSVFEGDELVLRCQKRGKEKMTAVRYIWNGKVISNSSKSTDVLIPQARLSNSGCYQCIGYLENAYVLKSNLRYIQIQELFSRPKVKVTDPQPTEGNSVNLSCETQLPLERPDTRLHFVFLRDNGVLLSNWSRSPELQIAAIWREDSGSYWCRAETVTSSVHKRSLPLKIHVQRIPVSDVLLEIQPQGDLVVEGETLVLVCSVAEGTGNITFSWHREDMEESLGKKSQRSQRAELEIPDIRESQAGSYYCAADNSYGLIQSEAVNVTVRSMPGNRGGLVAARATGGTLSTLLLAVALLFYCWHRRKPGDGFLGDTTRSPASPGPGEHPHPVCPAPVGLQLLYDNVHLRERDLVYSEIQIVQPGEEGAASTSRTSVENKPILSAVLVVLNTLQ